MANKTKTFDKNHKKNLLEPAREVIAGFADGVILKDDPAPHDWGDNGVTLFEPYAVRFTERYVKAVRDFTQRSAKTLKSKSAHEKTIRTLCQKAGQQYVELTYGSEAEIPDALEKAAAGLVHTVLAEAGREYVHVEPNFIVRHTVADIISLGRVRSMRTELAAANTPLAQNTRINLAVGDYPTQSFDQTGTITLEMPESVWVVDVPATRENVPEEAKWLIDVAISLMRLSAQTWPGHFPTVGDVEGHPTYPSIYAQPHVTMEGDTAFTGGGKLTGWYEIDAGIASKLSSPEVQGKADALFDPTDRSLAQHVANGLGWMTRGRQASDRAERLLSLFTALEAVLTSTDKADPITQTISRHVSVIYTQDLKTRVGVYNQIKGLYSLRSSVVHAGHREVLWQDVNNLQRYVETIFWIILKRCDLGMTQMAFAQSLTDASHGPRWEFAAPAAPEPVAEPAGPGLGGALEPPATPVPSENSP